jgi:hypothetical protein
MHRTEGANNTTDINGNSIFTEGPPATTIPANWLNAIQEEIANVIEQTGGTLLQGTTDTKDQLWDAIRTTIQPYDFVVNSQATFQNAIERVGANQYKIKSAYKSIYFRNITGGYSMPSAASSLSSGVDSWGYLETNACTHLEFENGGSLNMSSQQGYIEVNTADCYLKNVHVTGDGTAAQIEKSFLLNNVRVTYDNCRCSNRNADGAIVTMNGFEASGTFLHNITSKYINCTAYTLDAVNTAVGFNGSMNMTNCISYDIDSSSGSGVAFSACLNLSSCVAYDIDGTAAQGFASCEQMAGCYAFQVTAATGEASGFDNCDKISASYATDIDTAGGAGNTYGFTNCDTISACQASDIDSAGGNAEGFNDCNYGASLFTGEAANSGNDWIDSADPQIVNQVSTPNVWT